MRRAALFEDPNLLQQLQERHNHDGHREEIIVVRRVEESGHLVRVVQAFQSGARNDADALQLGRLTFGRVCREDLALVSVNHQRLRLDGLFYSEVGALPHVVILNLQEYLEGHELADNVLDTVLSERVEEVRGRHKYVSSHDEQTQNERMSRVLEFL